MGDQPVTCELLSALLQDEYEVEVCHDGESAVRWMESFRPDVILCATFTPGVSSAEVIKRLRANPRNAAVPVVIVTGAIGGEAGSRDRKGVRLLAKPFHVAELFETVARAIACGA